MKVWFPCQICLWSNSTKAATRKRKRRRRKKYQVEIDVFWYSRKRGRGRDGESEREQSARECLEWRVYDYLYWMRSAKPWYVLPSHSSILMNQDEFRFLFSDSTIDDIISAQEYIASEWVCGGEETIKKCPFVEENLRWRCFQCSEEKKTTTNQD